MYQKHVVVELSALDRSPFSSMCLQESTFPLDFSHDCPEPVLVEMIIFSIEWLQKRRFPHLRRRFSTCGSGWFTPAASTPARKKRHKTRRARACVCYQDRLRTDIDTEREEQFEEDNFWLFVRTEVASHHGHKRLDLQKNQGVVFGW